MKFGNELSVKCSPSPANTDEQEKVKGQIDFLLSFYFSNTLQDMVEKSNQSPHFNTKINAYKLIPYLLSIFI